MDAGDRAFHGTPSKFGRSEAVHRDLWRKVEIALGICVVKHESKAMRRCPVSHFLTPHPYCFACGQKTVPAENGHATEETGSTADIESAVCEDIKRRQHNGITKYGMSVAENPLSQREWLTHAYEEALDLAVYLRKIIDGVQSPEQA
jgi:hypothetical protein